MFKKAISEHIKIYHVFLAILGIIVISLLYVTFFDKPIDAETMQMIRENRPTDLNELKANKMQVLFMRERGWSFIVFSCLVLAILTWIIISNQRKGKIDFMGYRFRLQNRFVQNELKEQTFQDRLSKKFNGLTTNDVLIAELLIDGYSTKEIASELNISVPSANTARYRLRKKMDLTSDIDLVNFLKQI